MTQTPARPALPPELDPRRSPGRPLASPGRARRILTLVAVLTSAAIFLTSVGLYLAFRHYGAQVETLPGLGKLKSAQAGKTRAENYLVVGSDSGDGLTDAQLREVGANRVGRAGTRTDTILLVHIPASRQAASFVSFPRDSYVRIPGVGFNKINSAYQYGEKERAGGGPSKLIATVQALSGQHVDHYVEVSLFGFYTITNAVGGVDVCLTRPAREQRANINLPAGRQTLDGKEALAFVRQRYGVPGGDLGRIKRQQYFLGALTRKVLSAGVLLNPFRLHNLLNAAGSSVKVDGGTSRGDLLDLGLKMRAVSAGKVKFQTVPVADSDGRRDIAGQPNASVVVLDSAALPGFFAALDGPAPAPTGSAAALTVPPSAISLAVENGTTRSGLARQVGTALTGVGFRVREVRTAARNDYPGTVVRYGTARAQSARTVAAAVPGAVVRPDPALPASGLVVTVGASYRGVQRVSVPAPGTATKSPSKATTAADKGCIA